MKKAHIIILAVWFVMTCSSMAFGQQGTVIIRDKSVGSRQATVTAGGALTVTGTTTSTTVTAACTQATLVKFQTTGVANSAGTSVTSTTSCIAGPVYVTNTSNSTVTFRLQDKTGTPVIWVGGNADFSIPANSNLRIDLTGLVFTSGITAIAGTNAVLNLYIPTLQ